jgi:hypothetical protein
VDVGEDEGKTSGGGGGARARARKEDERELDWSLRLDLTCRNSIPSLPRQMRPALGTLPAETVPSITESIRFRAPMRHKLRKSFYRTLNFEAQAQSLSVAWSLVEIPRSVGVADEHDDDEVYNDHGEYA